MGEAVGVPYQHNQCICRPPLLPLHPYSVSGTNWSIPPVTDPARKTELDGNEMLEQKKKNLIHEPAFEAHAGIATRRFDSYRCLVQPSQSCGASSCYGTTDTSSHAVARTKYKLWNRIGAQMNGNHQWTEYKHNASRRAQCQV